MQTLVTIAQLLVTSYVVTCLPQPSSVQPAIHVESCSANSPDYVAKVLYHHSVTLILEDRPSFSLCWLGDLDVVLAAQRTSTECELMTGGNVWREKLTVNNLITLRLFKACRKIGNVFEVRLWVMGLFSLGKREIEMR